MLSVLVHSIDYIKVFLTVNAKIVCTEASVFEHFVQTNTHEKPLPSQLVGSEHTGVKSVTACQSKSHM